MGPLARVVFQIEGKRVKHYRLLSRAGAAGMSVLRMEEALAPGPFVAVEVVASETAETATLAAAVPSAPIEIRLRCGHNLLVEPDFEAGHLRRLLRALEQEL